MKYTMNIHLAAGVTMTVDGVTEDDANKYPKILNNANGVVTISGGHGKVQHVPVRNILVVEFVEEAKS